MRAILNAFLRSLLLVVGMDEYYLIENSLLNRVLWRNEYDNGMSTINPQSTIIVLKYDKSD